VVVSMAEAVAEAEASTAAKAEAILAEAVKDRMKAAPTADELMAEEATLVALDRKLAAV
jgi:hypothetical protein